MRRLHQWMLGLLGWGMGLGLHAATLAELKQDALNPMTFTPATLCTAGACRPAVVASGVIMGDTPARLGTYLSTPRKAPPQVVLLDSPGGAFNMSIVLGLLIRKQGLDTYVAPGARCNSGCFYVFLGGVHRQVANHEGLGVHVNSYLPHSPLDPNYQDASGLYTEADVTEAARESVAEVGIQIRYFAAMGVRPETLNEIFRSFGPLVAVSPGCAHYLRVDNSAPAPVRDPCVGEAGVAALIGEDVGIPDLSAEEANRMLRTPVSAPTPADPH